MNELQKQAYLDAMGIDVWQLRQPLQAEVQAEAATPPQATTIEAQAETAIQLQPATIHLGPGKGGTLLICADNTDSASRLANDIERALGNGPVWAWPEEGQQPLESAVDEQLFTVVAIFGDTLAGQFFAGSTPASIKTARLVLLPSMQDVLTSAKSRRQLWDIFCREGMVSVN
jgi:DNA polymerase III psi subunit